MFFWYIKVMETFHISEVNGFSSMGHLASCCKCDRKILVEMTLIGVQHHISLHVTCADCLVLGKDFREKHPKEAKQLEEWQSVQS